MKYLRLMAYWTSTIGSITGNNDEKRYHVGQLTLIVLPLISVSGGGVR